jgi:hypothetical protein
LLLIPILPLAAGKEKEYFREGGSISIFQPLLSSYSRASIQDFDPFHVLGKDAVPDHPRRHDGRLFPFRDVPAGKIGHTTPKTDNALPYSKRVTAASGFRRQICAAVLGPAATPPTMRTWGKFDGTIRRLSVKYYPLQAPVMG